MRARSESGEEMALVAKQEHSKEVSIVKLPTIWRVEIEDEKHTDELKSKDQKHRREVASQVRSRIPNRKVLPKRIPDA